MVEGDTQRQRRPQHDLAVIRDGPVVDEARVRDEMVRLEVFANDENTLNDVYAAYEILGNNGEVGARLTNFDEMDFAVGHFIEDVLSRHGGSSATPTACTTVSADTSGTGQCRQDTDPHTAAGTACR